MYQIPQFDLIDPSHLENAKYYSIKNKIKKITFIYQYLIYYFHKVQLILIGHRLDHITLLSHPNIYIFIFLYMNLIFMIAWYCLSKVDGQEQTESLGVVVKLHKYPQSEFGMNEMI